MIGLRCLIFYVAFYIIGICMANMPFSLFSELYVGGIYSFKNKKYLQF